MRRPVGALLPTELARRPSAGFCRQPPPSPGKPRSWAELPCQCTWDRGRWNRPSTIRLLVNLCLQCGTRRVRPIPLYRRHCGLRRTPPRAPSFYCRCGVRSERGFGCWAAVKPHLNPEPVVGNRPAGRGFPGWSRRCGGSVPIAARAPLLQPNRSHGGRAPPPAVVSLSSNTLPQPVSRRPRSSTLIWAPLRPGFGPTSSRDWSSDPGELSMLPNRPDSPSCPLERTSHSAQGAAPLPFRLLPDLAELSVQSPRGPRGYPQRDMTWIKPA